MLLRCHGFVFGGSHHRSRVQEGVSGEVILCLQSATTPTDATKPMASVVRGACISLISSYQEHFKQIMGLVTLVLTGAQDNYVNTKYQGIVYQMSLMAKVAH